VEFKCCAQRQQVCTYDVQRKYMECTIHRNCCCNCSTQWLLLTAVSCTVRRPNKYKTCTQRTQSACVMQCTDALHRKKAHYTIITYTNQLHKKDKLCAHVTVIPQIHLAIGLKIGFERSITQGLLVQYCTLK
jgi:hypothetical protein